MRSRAPSAPRPEGPESPLRPAPPAGRKLAGRALAGLAWLGLLLPGLATGCIASPPELRAEQGARAFYRGDLEAAVRLSERRLDRARGGADEGVARLDLAIALQAAGRPLQAAELLVAADDELEVLDYTTAPLEVLADVVFSRARSGYRARRHERILLHVEALLGFLSGGKPVEAAVEARRARVLLLQADLPGEDRAASRLAWALCGTALDAAGAHAEAADCYATLAALPGGEDLAREFSRPAGPGEGAVLVVVRDGMAPVRAQAIYRLWVAGALRRVNVPALVGRPSGFERASIALDGGAPRDLPVLLDVERQAAERWSGEFPRLLASAALAAVPRALLQDAVTRAVRDGDRPEGDVRNVLAEFLGYFAAEAVAEALPADTRAWTLLPARVRAARFVVPAGRHELAVESAGPVGGGAPRRADWVIEVGEGALVVASDFTAVGAGWRAPLLPDPPPGTDLTARPVGVAARELLGAALHAGS